MADRRRLISESITASLNLVHDFEVVEAREEYGDSQKIVASILRIRPTAVLLGAIGDDKDAFDIAEGLSSETPRCGVVVIANNPTKDLVKNAMKNSISVLPSDARLSYLVHALRGIDTGCPTIYPELLHTQEQKGSKLNERECEVLRLTIRGYPIKTIAEELFLAPGTVRNLTSSGIKKLQGRNRFDAARIALANGWIWLKTPNHASQGRP